MPYSDIANMLGVSLKTIYNNVSIAVDAVAKALDIKVNNPLVELK